MFGHTIIKFTAKWSSQRWNQNVFPVHTMKAYRTKGTNLLILTTAPDEGKQEIQTPPVSISGENHRYPVKMWLGLPYSHSGPIGKEKNRLPLAELEH
jgi:hypothetical protein